MPRRKEPEMPPPVYLTPEAIERLRERLVRLKRDLPAAAAEAKSTAEYGDRSDNAAYKEAKGILRRLKGQIIRIEAQLKYSVVIEKGANPDGTIRLGSTVTLEQRGGGARRTFEIVGPFETDPARARISHESPLGAALIGKKSGDTILVKTPDGNQEYKILAVK